MTAQVIAAAPVPFTDSGDLDLPEYEKMLARLDGHVDGVLVAGTTAEFPALDDSERLTLCKVAAEILDSGRVMAHLGHASSRQVLRLAEQTAALGIRQFALLTPYYLPPDDEGVVAHYKQLTEAHPDAQVHAYLFPERTGVTVTVDVLRRVMDLPGMDGVKLSGQAAACLPDYRGAVRAGQRIYSGDDASLPWVISHGGTGVVSGVAAAFPELFSTLVRALDGDDPAAVEAAQSAVVHVVGLVGPTIPTLKLALATRSGGPWRHRMALPTVDEATATSIKAAVARHT